MTNEKKMEDSCGRPTNSGVPILALEPQESDHFRQIADNLHEVIALSNADLTEFLYVNKAYLQIWGQPPETLYARPRSFLDGVHQDDRQRFEEALQGLIRGKPIYDLECRVMRPDGSVAWVSCRGYPVRDASGRIQRLVGSAQEITKRKNAEERLRESEDRYRDLVEHSQDLICTHDVHGVLLSVNEAPLRILGYSKEEILNRPLRDLVTPETRHHCDLYLDQIQKTGYAKGILHVLTKSGEVRLWEFNNSLRQDGTVIPIVRGIAHDVTERKQAEDKLFRSEWFLREGQRLTHTGSWVWSVSSGLLTWSAETYRIFGIDSATVIPTLEVFMRFVHPEDRANVQNAIDQVARDKRNFEIDYRIVLHDGSTKHVRSVGRPVLTSSGKLLEFVGTAMDITERKLAENELRRLSGQLLRLQDDERRQVARNLHDTTGQNLIGLIALLDQLQTKHPSRKLVRQSKNLAEQCLHEIRTLSYELFPQMLDEAGLQSAIRNYISGYSNRTGIQVEFLEPPGILRMSPETELALFRVVQECLINVHRHSGSQTARIVLARKQGRVWLEVGDAGHGIASTPDKPNGTAWLTTGVGIPSMKERVKPIGGNLQIESSQRGTSVRVEVPADE